MQPFEIDDIVKFIWTDDGNYYFKIVDISDFSFIDEHDDIIEDFEYKLERIYPITNINIFEFGTHEELDIVAKNNSSEHKLIIEYIEEIKESYSKYSHEDKDKDKDNFKHVTETKNDKNNKNNKKKKSIKFGEKEIKKILDNDKADILMEEYIGRMNTHLELLSKAISEDNLEKINFQKEQLKKVRDVLMELEYFGL